MNKRVNCAQVQTSQILPGTRGGRPSPNDDYAFAFRVLSFTWQFPLVSNSFHKQGSKVVFCLAYNSPCDTALTFNFPASLIRFPASSNCILRSPPRELTYLALITPRHPPCRRPKLYIQRVRGAAHEILREPSYRRSYSRFERYIGDRRWHNIDMHI